MKRPDLQDLHPLTGVLIAIRDAVEWCRPLLADQPDPALVRELLDTAAVTSEIPALLLHQAVPSADDEDEGAGEALERAGELAADARRHFVTGLHLMAGAHAITSNIADGR